MMSEAQITLDMGSDAAALSVFLSLPGSTSCKVGSVCRRGTAKDALLGTFYPLFLWDSFFPPMLLLSPCEIPDVSSKF